MKAQLLSCRGARKESWSFLSRFLIQIPNLIVLLLLIFCAMALSSKLTWAQANQQAQQEDEMVGVPLGPKPKSTLNPLAKSPFDVPEQAIGFYSKGSMINAIQFPLEDDGLIKLFRPRNRAWATTDLVSVVQAAIGDYRSIYANSEQIQIGDVANEHGGSIGLHASHQNGLDADIAYLRLDHGIQDPNSVAGFEESFVKSNQISNNFDFERNWALVKALVSSGKINRIFVDKSIKRELCEKARIWGEYTPDLEYLRRLRPWPNHDDHMHVRITCPDTSPQCLMQAEPPAGNGCAEAGA